jgi:hypothetical protein
VLRSIVPALLLFDLGASPLQAQTAPDPYRSARLTADADFAAWLAAFRPKALAEGVSAATLDRELAGLALNARVIALDRSQPDDSRPHRAGPADAGRKPPRSGSDCGALWRAGAHHPLRYRAAAVSNVVRRGRLDFSRGIAN